MKYAIYGANRIAKDFMYILEDIEVVCFFDDEQEGCFCGKKVYRVDQILQYSQTCDKIIVCDFDKRNKIKKLNDLGLEYKKHYLYDEDFFSLMDIWQVPEDRKIAIWGMGRVGNRFVEDHPEIKVDIIIDKNVKNKDTGIISPEQIMDWNEYFTIITVTNYHEIVDYLQSHNLKEYVDFVTYSEYEMRPSSLLRKTIFDTSCYEFDCDTMHNHLEVLAGGNTSCCCTTFVSLRLGSIVEKNVSEIWNSIAHKILCLSTENKTYSFCDKNMCPFFIGKMPDGKLDLQTPYKKMDKNPSVVALGYDRICNLKCTSCRENYYMENKYDCNLKEVIAQKVETELLDNCRFLIAAGDGEVLLSKYYKKIYTSEKAKNIPFIRFLSNGMLFTQNKWEEIRKNNTGKIMLTVSIDAAKKETYEQIRRGGNFDVLKQNMQFASDLRKAGELSYFRINFVVQKKNYREMIPFVKWGLELECDEIFFTKILNWGTYSKEEFRDISMMEEDGITPKKELQEILQDPVMRNPKVDLGTIQYSHDIVDDKIIENYYMWELERKVPKLFEGN